MFSSAMDSRYGRNISYGRYSLQQNYEHNNLAPSSTQVRTLAANAAEMRRMREDLDTLKLRNEQLELNQRAMAEKITRNSTGLDKANSRIDQNADRIDVIEMDVGHFRDKTVAMFKELQNDQKINVQIMAKLLERKKEEKPSVRRQSSSARTVPKPIWMSQSMYNAAGPGKKFDGSIRCPGCNKKFTRDERYNRPDFDYNVHCMDQCDAYKLLELIAPCRIEGCPLKFLTAKSRGRHEWTCEHLPANPADATEYLELTF